MPLGKYYPLFLEELFIVHLYGTNEEVDTFYRLMDPQHRNKPENIVELATLIEDIKRRNLTNMNWYCCSRCENFKICRINWHRGEKNLERNCCTYCQDFEKCYEIYKKMEKEKEDKEKD